MALTTDGKGNLNVNLAGGSITGNAAAGPTGSPVPADADYIGFNVGGDLVGVSSSNPLPVTGGGGSTQYTDGTAETAGAFTITVAGLYDGTDVVGLRGDPFNNLYVNLNTAIPAGSALIGQVEISDGTNILGTPTHPIRIDPTGTTVQPISGTVAVTQSTSPWVDNLTQVAGVTLGATAVTAFGTAPAAANAPGVNSSIFAGTTGITATGTSLNVNVTGGATSTIAGSKSNNSVAPGATNLGVLPGIANAATQTWTEGDQVLQSMDLSGRQRTRGTLTPNNAAPGSDNQGVLPAIANAANPSWTEGDQVLLSENLSGYLRVVATGAAAINTAVTGNPLYIGGTYTASPATITSGDVSPLQTSNKGWLLVSGTSNGINAQFPVNTSEAKSVNAEHSLTVVTLPDVNTAFSPLVVADTVYGGAFSGAANNALQGWNNRRTPTVFRTVQATASGNTAVWTPGSGNKFRLLRLFVEVTDNASLAAGAVLTINFQDATTSINISFDVFVPTTAVTTVIGDGLEQELDLGEFGILSAAANNVLNVNLSAALATGNVRVIAMGTEE